MIGGIVPDTFIIESVLLTLNPAQTS